MIIIELQKHIKHTIFQIDNEKVNKGNGLHWKKWWKLYDMKW